MNRIGLSICFVLALWKSSSLASEPAFLFSREINNPSLPQEELIAVTLDRAVFAATEVNLPDIRLLDGQGGAVPYLIRRVQSTRPVTARRTWPPKQPEARPLDGGGLEIMVKLKEKDPIPNGLSLISQLKNFEQRVQVFSSADGEQWEPLGEESVIFDYSRFMDVRRDSVRFQETSNRHFRIVIDDVTSEQESELLELTRRLRGAEETERQEQVTIERRPFRIERVDFWREAERDESTGDKKTDYPVDESHVVQDPQKQQTTILVDTNREPLTSLELQTSARNFSRRAAVEVEEKRGVQSSWQAIGEATLKRIDFKGLKQEKLSVKFPESRRANYRLVIYNRDSPPLQVDGLKARGNVYELLFLASPGTHYQIAYGSVDADHPEYDTAAIVQLLGQGFQPTQASLGPAAPGAAPPAAFRWSDLFKNRGLLFGAITLLVIALAWSLYHAVKRLDNLPGQSEES